jgi:exodeoxyribonuclease VII large subunit
MSIDDYGINIDNVCKNIKKILNSNIITKKELLNLKVQQVKQINPNLLLSKGYAIVRDKNNKIVKSINDVTLQCELEIQVRDGLIKVKRKE